MPDREELDTLVTFGSEVKALGENRFGGYLARFTGADDPDLTGDYFTSETDFDADFPAKATVYFNHGFDPALKGRKLGKADLRVDEAGIWAEMILRERDDYEKKLADLARAGTLGWSSGTAAHLVEREPEGKAYRITRWPLGLDASLTHTPAEPGNGVMALKSLFPKGELTMEKEELVTILDGFKSEMVKASAESATEAVKKFADELAPEVKAGFAGHVQIVKDEAEQPFKSAGEFLTSVKNAAIAPHAIDRRLLPLKATGLNEAIPSQGGFLVQQDQSLLSRQHVGLVALPNLQSRLLDGAGKRKRQRPGQPGLESNIHGIQTGRGQFSGLAARQERNPRNGSGDGS